MYSPEWGVALGVVFSVLGVAQGEFSRWLLPISERPTVTPKQAKGKTQMGKPEGTHKLCACVSLERFLI